MTHKGTFAISLLAFHPCYHQKMGGKNRSGHRDDDDDDGEVDDDGDEDDDDHHDHHDDDHNLSRFLDGILTPNIHYSLHE